ncbi:MAG: hypothetical protein OXI77_09230 [Chloroflexota bacterium]|nr:hypothetical protein [Chloroflexota bacterium]MDE2910816.1 hypothetical protein [Chloroflexota bacterium]
MKPKIPEGKTRLLLVEGAEDQEFFIQLGGRLTSTDDWLVQINRYRGRSELEDFLIAVAGHPRFGQVETIGIVRDADFNTDAFQSVQGAVRRANAEIQQALPVPEKVMVMAEGSKNVIVMIMPSYERQGMLEDLIMDIFQSDPITTCVDAYFNCIRKHGIAILEHKLSKGRLRAFVTGKNVSNQANGDDSEKLYLSDVFHMSWWKPEFWDHEAFLDAREFLALLTN